jgi:hypothetical protein
MTKKIPENLKQATNKYIDELQNYDLKTQLLVLVSLITANIVDKPRKERFKLFSFVISAIVAVLKHNESIKSVVDDLIKSIEIKRSTEHTN